MSHLVPFDFKNHSIRIIQDKNEEPLFVLADICRALGISNPTDVKNRLHEDDVQTIDLLALDSIEGNKNKDLVNVVNESGLYDVVFDSNKPEAKEFRHLVTSEILPSIRKTGSYSIDSQSQNIKAVQNTASLYPALATAFASIGIEGNQLALAVDKSAKSVTGITLLGVSGIKLIAPVQENSLPPKAIGVELGLSAQAVNKLLTEYGYQIKHRDHKGNPYYEQTEKSKTLSEFVDTNKKHSNGTPVKQLKWYFRVVEEIKNCMKVAA